MVATREHLIDIAGQLFARKGVEATTMGDIASASERGRRTLYTYFRNKKELYAAVMQTDGERLLERLQEVVRMDAPVEERLRRFLSVRLVERRRRASAAASLRALFRPDFKRLSRVRSIVRKPAQAMLHALLAEGIAEGSFDADRCAMLEGFALDTMHAMDIAGADQLTDGLAASADAMLDFILSSLGK